MSGRWPLSFLHLLRVVLDRLPSTCITSAPSCTAPSGSLHPPPSPPAPAATKEKRKRTVKPAAGSSENMSVPAAAEDKEEDGAEAGDVAYVIRTNFRLESDERLLFLPMRRPMLLVLLWPRESGRSRS